MASPDRPVTINMSCISVGGVGGLGMVALAGLMTVVFPQAWWVVVFGVSGGSLIAAAMVAVRRHRVPAAPSGDRPYVLFGPVDRYRTGE